MEFEITRLENCIKSSLVFKCARNSGFFLDGVYYWSTIKKFTQSGGFKIVNNFYVKVIFFNFTKFWQWRIAGLTLYKIITYIIRARVRENDIKPSLYSELQ